MNLNSLGEIEIRLTVTCMLFVKSDKIPTNAESTCMSLLSLSLKLNEEMQLLFQLFCQCDI